MKKISMLLIVLSCFAQATARYTHWYVNSTPEPVSFVITYRLTHDGCPTQRVTLQPEGMDGDRLPIRNGILCSISSICSQGNSRFTAYEPSAGFAGSAVFHFERATAQSPVTLTRKLVTTKIPRRPATRPVSIRPVTLSPLSGGAQQKN